MGYTSTGGVSVVGVVRSGERVGGGKHLARERHCSYKQALGCLASTTVSSTPLLPPLVGWGAGVVRWWVVAGFTKR